MMVVVYVKTTTRRRGDKTYTYLSLVEAERVGGTVKHHTLLRLGEVSELRDTGQLDRIIGALKAHAEGQWTSGSAIESEGSPGLGAMAAVHAYFTRLGLDDHFARVGRSRKAPTLADTVYVLLANRLLSPSSKRRTVVEWLSDVAVPDGVSTPSLDQCYRSLDALFSAKGQTEQHLYARVTDLTNLDLRLCCYDLTSTYFETTSGPDSRFASRAFGYSRDHRSDRPQVMIGLLITGDGIPIAHHVFAGNTNDASTLDQVMADLQERFGVGRIALVADRGLISEKNLAAVADRGFDHVMTTKLHRDPDVRSVLAASKAPTAVWVPVASANSAACEVVHDGRRFVVVASLARFRRDNLRREAILSRTEDKLIALAERVAAGQLSDPAKIGAAADRILVASNMARCFTTAIRKGSFSWDYDQEALDYEVYDLAGRYVLTTSLAQDQASTADVVRHYRTLEKVERRFRVMKDFLALRPVFHYTEARVRGHIALCVIASVIEAMMALDLERADIMDPDIDTQVLSVRRALAELDRIRVNQLTIGERRVDVVTRRNALQVQVLGALGVDTSSWDRASIA